MNTEQIRQNAAANLLDALFSYLIKESNKEILSPELQEIFKYIPADEVGFILDGLYSRFYPDDRYFQSPNYNGEHYLSIPHGELEIERETWEKLPEEEKEDWTEDNGLYYQPLLAITIVFDLGKVQAAVDRISA